MRLTTTGRRSGKPRSVILGYYEDGPNLVSMAMNGWGAAEPAWWLNLQADPQAVVELAGGSGARCSAGLQWVGSVNDCGSAGVNWTRTSTVTRHVARKRRRSSSPSRARRPNEEERHLSRDESVGRTRSWRLELSFTLLWFDAIPMTWISDCSQAGALGTSI